MAMDKTGHAKVQAEFSFSDLMDGDMVVEKQNLFICRIYIYIPCQICK